MVWMISTVFDSAGSTIDLDSRASGSDIKVRLERDGVAGQADATLKGLLYPIKEAPQFRNGIATVEAMLVTNGGYLPSAHRVVGIPARRSVQQHEERFFVTVVRGESGSGKTVFGKPVVITLYYSLSCNVSRTSPRTYGGTRPPCC